MAEILSRCGYRCDMCLAYRPNVEANESNRQILSDGWHKYFGFRIKPEETVCDGCFSGADGKRIDKDCSVRLCVVAKGFSNCSECADYGCEELRHRWVVYEEMAKAVGFPIPEEDRARFIAPYENKARLDQLRSPR